MLIHLLITLICFLGIWFGTGITLSAVERISHRLQISSFAISFLLLGFFTSISELSVGLNSIFNNEPEIYVGNLIGASIVIFMLIIPLLAITGKQININHQLQGKNLVFPLVVVSLPVLQSLDGIISKNESLVSMVLFIILSLMVQKKRGLLEDTTRLLTLKKVKVLKELFKTIFGITIIYIFSHYIVEQTEYFSKALNLTPFLISLLFVSIGTNLPELSILIKSIFLKNNQIAFGDYVGSASVNTFLFGLLTLLYGHPVTLTNNYLISLIFLIFGLLLFFLFARSKNTITRIEGFYLLCFYVLFLVTEYFIHKYV